MKFTDRLIWCYNTYITMDMSLELITGKEEVYKLKQLVCSHNDTSNYSNLGTTEPLPCSCCGKFNKKCNDCGFIIEHECNDHSEDGYCGSCR